ncbi:hypothetical protein C5C07_20070 [Haloferax sp. Atlit-4N]|uniref:hypothetical protein n=1 Tax=Haloferax sp. Atlit-4N TaxID=2077206 RepID=UPI000E282D85|nr:hypothetical protein [Haloferax sp. Atlit-4N]RDZ49815.1 hypothetical protein C5C07_20070 [Haloferax sp. Atlit-4N]
MHDTTEPELQSLVTRINQLESTIADQQAKIETLEDELEAEREARVAVEDECRDIFETLDRETHPRLDAFFRRTENIIDGLSELQARTLEKGGHLLEDNVDAEHLDVHGHRLERITKDDGKQYVRLPGEEDPLARGGHVAHTTADLLPLQRLARFDDEMLASMTNRKPDELAAKAWRHRDDPGRYNLWSKGSGNLRVYLSAPDLADWIRQHEPGVSKKYSQELARRTIESMLELARGRLGKTKQERRTDGLTYHETRIVLHSDTDLPGERPVVQTNAAPTTDAVAGE